MEHIDRHVKNKRQSAFLKAIILGINRDRDVFSSIQLSGMSHFICVSGFHLGLVVFVVWWIFKLVWSYAGFIKRIEPVQFAAFGSILVATFYAFLTGCGPATERAWIMVLCVVGPQIFLLRVRTKDALLVAAFIMLTRHPTWLYGFGFQCSFFITCLLLNISRVKKSSTQKASRRIRRYLWVHTVAFLGACPLLLFHFGCINVLSILANSVALPIITFVVMPLGFIGLFVALVTTRGECLQIAGWFVDHVFNIAELFQVGHVELHRMSVLGTISVAILLLVAVSGRLPLKKMMFFFFSIFFIVLWSQRPKNVDEKSLTVTFVDVGQGDAALIEFPNGVNWLMDVGGQAWGVDGADWGYPTENSLVPLLKKKRIDYCRESCFVSSACRSCWRIRCASDACRD